MGRHDHRWLRVFQTLQVPNQAVKAICINHYRDRRSLNEFPNQLLGTIGCAQTWAYGQAVLLSEQFHDFFVGGQAQYAAGIFGQEFRHDLSQLAFHGHVQRLWNPEGHKSSTNADRRITCHHCRPGFAWGTCQNQEMPSGAFVRFRGSGFYARLNGLSTH